MYHFYLNIVSIVKTNNQYFLQLPQQHLYKHVTLMVEDLGLANRIYKLVFNYLQ